MRPLAILGLLLVAAGGFIAFRGLSYTSQEEVLNVGPIKAQVEQQKTVPTWVGGALALAGVGLLVAGSRRRG